MRKKSILALGFMLSLGTTAFAQDIRVNSERDYLGMCGTAIVRMFEDAKMDRFFSQWRFLQYILDIHMHK